jgi:ribosomal protein S12 methylthiotransferase accessory factor
MRENKERSIGLIGQGAIYEYMKRHLAYTYPIIPCTVESIPDQLAASRFIVYCSDTWSPGTLQEINRCCLQSGVAFLPVYTQFGTGMIGPCVIPHIKGCASCAEFRILGATSSEADHELLHQYLFKESKETRAPLVSQPWLSSFSLDILTALVGEEISAYFSKADQLQTHNAVLSISLETLDYSRHPFQPLSYCPDCGELAPDTAEMAVITLQSRPKPDVLTYRAQQAKANGELLQREYVDARTGLIYVLTTENRNLLPIASSLLCTEHQDGVETAEGTGCTLRTEQSKIVSICEVIERYAGLRPRSKRTAIQASYQQLVQQKQPVLNPATLGLHTPEQYEYYQHNHNSHHLVPYHQDLSYNWVWGYSFQQQSPILVPEHYAYYGVPINHENPAFLYEISNGCALGNNLEEAIFHGIMEVVERDAFLLTWYAQLNLPRLNLHSVTDPMIRLLIEHLEHHSGYAIHAWNATLNHAIPCLWVLGVDEQNREGMPKVHVVAGSHPHPEQALLRALRELTTSLEFSPQSYQQRRAGALAMFTNAGLVKEMPDHPLVYYLPEAFDRFHFLYSTQQQQTFQEAFGDPYRHMPASMDLRDDLTYLINYYLNCGIDTIVVDQTAPEHIPCGLRCVKIIMPGMLPMTFGQHNRRITGFERLHQLPFILGYKNHPLTEAEINPHPHPFF